MLLDSSLFTTQHHFLFSVHEHTLWYMYMRCVYHGATTKYGLLYRPGLETIWTPLRWYINHPLIVSSWWRHQMGTFAALLAFCEGNPAMTGGPPSQKPATRNLCVFFDLLLNKRLSKQPRRLWFETQSRSLWRHCNVDYCTSNHTMRCMNITFDLADISIMNGYFCGRLLYASVEILVKHPT